MIYLAEIATGKIVGQGIGADPVVPAGCVPVHVFGGLPGPMDACTYVGNGVIAVDPAVAAEIAAAAALAQAKERRREEVDAIKVTTQAGNTFDGDEISQGRMARAVLALTAAGGTVKWVLADNTIINATAQELSEALALAGSAQASIWIRPYEPA